MVARILGRGASVVGLWACLGSSASGQLADSPWPTMHRDLQRTGRSPSIGPEEPIEKWRFQLNETSFSGIAIGADGTIYVGDSSGLIYAVNPDGTERWRFDTGAFSIHFSGPTIADDGTIYIGTSDTMYYTGLFALNPDGTKKWQFITWMIYGSPTLDADGNIYVGSREAYVIAIDPNGKELWRFGDPDETYYFTACPTLGHDGRLYAPTGAFAWDLYCLTRDGEEVWAQGVNGSFAGATIASDGTIYTATEHYGLKATAPHGGLLWSANTGDSYSLPCLAENGTIFVTGQNGLSAVSPDGDVLWVQPASYVSRPVIDGAGTVYIGTDSSEVRAYNLDTDFALASGTLIAGDLDDLAESDDEYVRTRSAFGFQASEPNLLDLRIGLTNQLPNPESLDLTIESRINNPGGTAWARLRNWSSGAFDEVGSYPIGTLEQTVTLTDIDAANRVRNIDGRIELSLKHVVVATFALSGFQSFFDRVQVVAR